MKHWQQFKKSFQWKRIFPVFLFDAIFFTLVYLVTTAYSKFLENKYGNILGGRTPEQVQQMIATNPGQMQGLMQNIQSMLTFFVITFIILLLFYLFTYSLSRSYIWSYLLKKKFVFKQHWRWNLLNLALIVPLIIYLFIFVIVKAITNYIITLINNEVVVTVLSGSISLILALIFMIFIYLVYYSYTERRKVWESIGKAFHLIKLKSLRYYLLFTLIIMALVNIILYFLGANLFLPIKTFGLINAAVFILILAWMRVYLVKIVSKV